MPAEQRNLKIVLEVVDKASGKLKSVTSATGKDFGALSKIASKLGVDVGQLQGVFGGLSGSMGSAGAAAGLSATAIGGLVLGIAALAAGVVAAVVVTKKLVSAFISLAQEGSRIQLETERLAITIPVLAHNMGVTADEANNLILSIREQNKSFAEALTISKGVIQAGLGMADAQKLLTAARNVGIASGKSSAEVNQVLLNSMLQMNPTMLQAVGLNVSAKVAYENLAQSLGVTTSQLTTAQKQQAIFNATMEEASKFNGLYDQAMTTTGKIMGSFKDAIVDTKMAIGFMVNAGMKPLAQSLLNLARGLRQVFFDGNKFREWVIAVARIIGAVFVTAIDIAEQVIRGFIQFFINMGAAMGVTGGNIENILNDMAGAFMWAGKIISHVMGVVIGFLVNEVAPAIGLFVGGAIKFIIWMVKMWQAHFQGLQKVIVAFFRSVGKIFGSALKTLVSMLALAGTIMSGNWGDVWDAFIRMMGNAWNTIVSIAEGAVNALLIPVNLVIDGMNAMGASITPVTANFSGWRAEVSSVSESVQGTLLPDLFDLEGAFTGLSDLSGDIINFDMPGLNSAFGNAAGGASDLGDATEKAGGKAGKAWEGLDKSIEQTSNAIVDAMDKTEKAIQDITNKMNELLLGRAQDRQSEEEKLATEFVRQEEKVQQLKQDLANETDAERRRLTEEELIREEEALRKYQHLELIIGAEINAARKRARNTDFENAVSDFSRQVMLIEQKFETEFRALEEKLVKEVETRDAILALREEALVMTQEFIESERAATVAAVNEMINKYNALTQAIKAAAAARSTGGGNSSLAISSRATGGFLNPGQVSVVGERGPEIFVPTVHGTVLPNHKVDGAVGGGTTINVTVTGNTISGDQDAESFAEKVGDAIIGKLALSHRVG